MASVLTKEGSRVAYRVPVIIQRLGTDIFLAKNESLGIFIQGDSEKYVLERFVNALKEYHADCPEELEPYKDADVRVVDL